ncbi:MAG: phosphoglycerate kinase [Nanoarchaeota archaeon]
MDRFTLNRFPIKDKTIFLRADFNVPLAKGGITDNTKIKATLDTIKFLLHNDCKIVIATHLGRPDTPSTENSTKVIAKELKRLLPSITLVHLSDCIGKEIKEKIEKGKPKTIFMLENLRFYKEEEQNDTFFAHSLATLAEIYVNDAFGVCHRKHASIDAITRYMPSIAGLLVEKELYYLSKALSPKKPAVLIMGGAKLNKIHLLENALRKYDYVLIGGALAFSFLKAKGIPIGMSKADSDSIEIAKKTLAGRNRSKIILPIDFKVAEKFTANSKTEIIRYNEIKPNQIGLDIGPRSVALFKKYLAPAKTIVWNGPLGYFEWASFAQSTKDIGRYLGTLQDSITIAGGGETTEALIKFHLHHSLTHLSTGGGASIAYLSGEKLPGITALEQNYKTFRRKII